MFRQGNAEYRRRRAVGSNIRHEFAINPHTDAGVAIDIRGRTCSQLGLRLTGEGWRLVGGAFSPDDGHEHRGTGRDLTSGEIPGNEEDWPLLAGSTPCARRILVQGNADLATVDNTPRQSAT